MEAIGIVAVALVAIIVPGIHIGITAAIAYTVFKTLTKKH